MTLFTNNLHTIVSQQEEFIPKLGCYKTLNWFENLSKKCQELFTDSVLIADRKKSISGKWDYILSAIHTLPTCLLKKKELAQFFTPSDVALYAAFNLLDNYRQEVIFDPCVGHGSLLIAAALVLSEKEQLSNWDLVTKLHGSEIDAGTRALAIKNIAKCLVKISPCLKSANIEAQLQKQIKLYDFNNYPNELLSGLRIIVNPPYKEGNKGNVWIPIIEKLINADITALSLIVPVSITSAKRTQSLRRAIFNKFPKISALHHEIRPRPLFRGIEQRISIIAATRDTTTSNEYRTTGFLRHKAGERMLVWKAPMITLNKNECNNMFPKVSPFDLAFFKEFEFCRQRVRLSEIPVTAECLEEVWVRTTGRYHLLAQYEKPIKINTKWKRLLVSKQIAPHLVSAFQNGDVLKWWQIFGDGRDISITSLYNDYGVRM
jgi:predicted RNA methylase